MTIGDLLIKGSHTLSQNSIENPYNEAVLLLAYLLQKRKEWIFTYRDLDLNTLKVNSCVINKFYELINRRATKEPFAYIIKNKEFFGLKFYVDPYVLIPRPETELIVEFILSYKFDFKHSLTLLDIGTGSGCIPIAIKYFSESYAKNKGLDFKLEFTATDISKNILNIAIYNYLKIIMRYNKKYDKNINYLEIYKFNNLNDKFIISDLFLEIECLKKYDIITSNPPYIDMSHYEETQETVKNFEPYKALFTVDKGLYFYKKIMKDASNYLKDFGLLIMETPRDIEKEMLELSKSFSFRIYDYLKDINGFKRTIILKKNN